jgi:hemerythrin
MPLWNSTLEIGVPAIDEQHKELFRRVDILLDVSNGSADRVPETLKFLGAYVVKHFRDEESLHVRSKYPKAELHKKMHIKFVSEFRDLKQQYEAVGEKLSVLMNINRVVVDWLKSHIMVHDKEFAAYYKSSGQL